MNGRNRFGRRTVLARLGSVSVLGVLAPGLASAKSSFDSHKLALDVRGLVNLQFAIQRDADEDFSQPRVSAKWDVVVEPPRAVAKKYFQKIRRFPQNTSKTFTFWTHL